MKKIKKTKNKLNNPKKPKKKIGKTLNQECSYQKKTKKNKKGGGKFKKPVTNKKDFVKTN
ncbi:MAG: hypothetical protein IPO26_07245 [Saprospiraceae bacterium]|nr:hypothetical protein [Saprospiraceae bacterium]